MFWIGEKFYDDFWNFDNRKFLELLEKAKKAKYYWKKQSVGSKEIQINLFNSVSRKELWKFINKFSIFVNSWIDIKWALWILIKQIKNTYLKGIVKEMKENIDHWITISETMKKYPKVFDSLTIALISVWEKTWLLWKILNELDKNLLESIELKWRIKSALMYPVIMVFLTVAMLVFMMVFIIPKITEAFASSWVELPALTQFIVAVSHFIIEKWYIMILWVVWIVVVYKMINKTYIWRLSVAKIAMRYPVFWYIVRMWSIVYFIQSFTTLLNSWVLLLESIRTASEVVPNTAYKKEIIRIKNEVEFGLTMSKALWLNTDYEESVYFNDYFPEDFAYIVNTWEETWSLWESLEKIWRNYNIELKRYIWNLSTLLEPMIIVFIWAMVWTIVIAIMLPFFQMWKVVQGM